MVITPQTEIRLLQCPLEADNLHQIKFSSKTDQYNYFNGLTSLTVDNCTYARENGNLRIPVNYDSAIKYNYVMYQNEAYSDKWFYAYITGYTYMNNDTTAIEIKTDVYQTWQFDFIWKQSFIEREHVNNDQIGLHTIPENLELGDYVCNGQVVDSTLATGLSDLCYVMCSTTDIALDPNSGKMSPTYGANYNGIYSGVLYSRFDSGAGFALLKEVFDGAGQGDAIVGLFMAPKFLAQPTSGSDIRVLPSNTPDVKTLTVAKKRTLDGYSPVNNKLKCYPYCYLLASNNNGASAIYKYEYFRSAGEAVSENCYFNVYSVLCPGCSIRLVPRNYKNLLFNDEEGLNLGKFPVCNWTTDMYTNWLTQNSINQSTNMIMGGVSAAAGTALLLSGGGTIAGVGMIAGGAAAIAHSLGEKNKAELTPPQANGNLNCGDVINASSSNKFMFYQMSIKSEFASIIDKYFTMFGYQVNRVGIPLQNSRSQWNFIKTNGANIEGEDIPQVAINELKEIFNTGVTLWHNADNIYNYNLSNNIVQGSDKHV